MVRDIIVIKKPRSDPLRDIPINFPKLDNLHLELLEVKKKLKKNLPLLKIVPRKGPLPPDLLAIANVYEIAKGITRKSKKDNKENFDIPKSEKKKKKVRKDSTEEQGDQEEELDDEKPKKKKKKRKDSGSKDKSQKDTEDQDLVEALGADDTQEEPLESSDIKESPNDPEPQESAGEEDEPEEDDPKEEPKVEEDDEYAGLTPEEREAKEKEEYVWRFKILKKKYKTASIPEFNEHDDITIMKNVYNTTLKDLELNDNVESYKVYMMGGFYATEFFLTNFMKLEEMEGFADSQMARMNKYDRLLVELGERSYNRWGTSIPVEIRLLFMIIFQAGLYYIIKVTSSGSNNSVAEIIKMIFGDSTAPKQEEPPKKKMRGPSIKVEEMRRVTNIDTEDEENNKTTRRKNTRLSKED
jgi:hypothetical protein